MQKVHEELERILPKAIALAEDIFKNPELGYKEFRSREKVEEALKDAEIPFTEVAYTGLMATLDSGKEGPCIGLIAEFDAVPVLGHPYASSDQNAAHACGHYAQTGVMLAVFLALKEAGVMERLAGKVKLFFTPAEEFCDMDYRRNLIREGKVSHSSGKQEMISLGLFDECAVLLSCHSMGLIDTDYQAEVGASLNGFCQKKVTFLGTEAHAGASPHLGVNALHAMTLAISAINALRESFPEEDCIRVHYIVTEGGQTVNSVPARTKMEMYIRGKTVEAIRSTERKVDRALRGAALAINCDLEIQNTPGYLPLKQDPALTELVRSQILRYMPESRIAEGTHGTASGDMGDLSMLFPTVEIGISGFKGRIHGRDFGTENEREAYQIPAHYFVDAVMRLLENEGAEAKRIQESFVPKFKKENYLAELDRLHTSLFYEREKE